MCVCMCRYTMRYLDLRLDAAGVAYQEGLEALDHVARALKACRVTY